MVSYRDFRGTEVFGSIAKDLLVILTLLERIGAETLETEAANNRNRYRQPAILGRSAGRPKS